MAVELGVKGAGSTSILLKAKVITVKLELQASHQRRSRVCTRDSVFRCSCPLLVLVQFSKRQRHSEEACLVMSCSKLQDTL